MKRVYLIKNESFEKMLKKIEQFPKDLKFSSVLEEALQQGLILRKFPATSKIIIIIIIM